jgi:hypothetical protein
MNNTLKIDNRLPGAGKTLGKAKEIIDSYINYSKSTHQPKLLSAIDRLFWKPTLFVCDTYQSMIELQKTFINLYPQYTECNFPICNYNPNSSNKEFFTNPDDPRFVSKGAIIVFVTKNFLNQGKINDLYFENHLSGFKEVVLDELSIDDLIVYPLSYYTHRFYKEHKEELNDKKIKDLLKKDFLSNHSLFDYNYMIDNPDDSSKMHWINQLKNNLIPITVLSCEKVIKKILIGMFDFEDINQESPDFSDNIVEFIPCYFNQTTTHLFDDKFRKRWNVDIWIANVIKGSDIKTPKSTKGSNKLIGKESFTLLSCLPTQELKIKFESINSIQKIFENFDEFCAISYFDDLIQRAGRTIMYRGGKNFKVMINQQIYKLIMYYQDELEVPFSCKLHDIDSELQKELDYIKLFSQEAQKNKRIKKYKIGSSSIEINKFINKYLEKDINKFITYDELKFLLEKDNIVSGNGKTLQPKIIADKIGLEINDRRVNGKKQRVIMGIGVVK